MKDAKIKVFSVVGVYRASQRPTGHIYIEGSKEECQQFLEDECGDNDLLHYNYAIIEDTLENQTCRDKRTGMMYWKDNM